MKRYAEYKDSGVKWLGKIPSHWEVKMLSQLCGEHFISNKNVHNQNLLSLSYGHIVNKDINTTDGLLPASFDTYQIVEYGNIILRLTDLQNDQKSLRVGMSTQKGIITSAYLCLQTKEDIAPKFLYYLLHTADIKKVFYGMGDGLRQSLNWKELRKLNAILPPIEEQAHIVVYLKGKTSKIDKYIKQREKEVKFLEELKQAEIANVVTKGLNPDVPMKDSGIPWLGMIPEHWEAKRLAQEFQENKKQNNDLTVTEAYKFNYGTLVRKDEGVDINEVADTYVKYTILSPNDIVINCLNLNYDLVSQRIAISENIGIITSAYLTIVPRKNISAKYYLYLFKAMDAMKLFHGMGTGIRLTLSFSELKKQYIPVPPLEEQQAIVEYIDSRIEKIDRYIAGLTAEIEYLKEFKQRLISDAVTGQIKVTD